MDRYYLLDRGFPYFAVVSAKEAAELYEAAEPQMRDGGLPDGFSYWIVAENGRGRSFKVITRVLPIPPEWLPHVCRQIASSSLSLKNCAHVRDRHRRPADTLIRRLSSSHAESGLRASTPSMRTPGGVCTAGSAPHPSTGITPGGSISMPSTSSAICRESRLTTATPVDLM